MKKKYVLFGKGISYSLSPVVHSAIAEYYDVDLDYEIMDLESSDEILNVLRSGEYDGANVTVPYKVDLIDKMDELDGSAASAFALNTIKVVDGKLIAYNTDSKGFLDVFDINDYKLKDKRVLVYGTGGVARAIVNALLDADCKTVLSEGRTPEHKVEIFRAFEKKAAQKMTLIYGLQGLICDVAINASVLGSSSFPELPIDISKMETKAVFDVVYDPIETEFIKMAKDRNLPAFTGIEMLICQAIRTFYIWYPEFHREDINMKLFNFVKESLKKNAGVDFKDY